MDKINRKVAALLAAGIISAIALAGGIPVIILGASNGNTPVLVIGIVMVAFDFYACPILFTVYANALSIRRTAKAVNEEHIYDIKNIAVQSGKNEEEIKKQILVCLEKGYISGLLFDGEKLSFNGNVKADKHTVYYKCANCGATVTYFSNEQPPVCPYCGTPHSGANAQK